MNANEIIMKLLEKGEVMPPGYTGQVILHCNRGSLCDIERRDRVRPRNRMEDIDGKFINKIEQMICAGK